MEIVSKSYNLSMNELLVLLAMKDARQLYGVFDKDFELPDESEVNTTVFNMGRRGIIEIDETPIVRDEIGELVEAIKEAQMLLIASSADDAVRDMAFYIGKKSVFLRFTGIEKERVRLEEVTGEQIVRILLESEWMIANNTSDAVIGDGLIRESDIGDGLFELDKSELTSAQGVSSALLLLNISSRAKISHLLLMQETLNDYIVMDDGYDRRVYQFSDKQLPELIGELINAGKEKTK